MNWEAVGIVSTLIASIATLMTLFYLAIQVRESNNLARSSSLLAVLDGLVNQWGQTRLKPTRHQRSLPFNLPGFFTL